MLPAPTVFPKAQLPVDVCRLVLRLPGPGCGCEECEACDWECEVCAGR